MASSNQKMVLCFNEAFPSSYSVLMFFHEKKIEFEAQRIDILEPDGLFEASQVPQLIMKATDSDEVFIGVEPILKRMDVHLNCNEIFFKDLENLMEELSFAVCLAPENMAKNKLCWPFHDEKVRQNFIKYILRNRPEFRQWLEAYDKKCGLKAHEKLLEIVEKALKHAEILLSEENRVGIWIGGIEFSLLDCRFTSLLVGLYQLGLEEMWSQGEKPNLSMYIQQAFNR